MVWRVDVAVFFEASVGLPYVKVNDVLQVGPLDADGEGLGGMEDEGDQPPGLGRRLSALDPRKDPEFELSALPPVEVDGVLAARLRPLHDGDPFLVVREEGEIQVGAARIRLGGDGKLCEDPLSGFHEAAVLG